MEFIKMIDNDLLNILIRLGGYCYNFFGYFAELANTKLVDGHIPYDFLNVSLYNPFTESIVDINFNLTWLDNLITIPLNLVIDGLGLTGVYVFEIFLQLLIPLVLLFFAIAFLKFIIDNLPTK